MLNSYNEKITNLIYCSKDNIFYISKIIKLQYGN